MCNALIRNISPSIYKVILKSVNVLFVQIDLI